MVLSSSHVRGLTLGLEEGSHFLRGCTRVAFPAHLWYEPQLSQSTCVFSEHGGELTLLYGQLIVMVDEGRGLEFGPRLVLVVEAVPTPPPPGESHTA